MVQSVSNHLDNIPKEMLDGMLIAIEDRYLSYMVSHVHQYKDTIKNV